MTTSLSPSVARARGAGRPDGEGRRHVRVAAARLPVPRRARGGGGPAARRRSRRGEATPTCVPRSRGLLAPEGLGFAGLAQRPGAVPSPRRSRRDAGRRAHRRGGCSWSAIADDVDARPLHRARGREDGFRSAAGRPEADTRTIELRALDPVAGHRHGGAGRGRTAVPHRRGNAPLPARRPRRAAAQPRADGRRPGAGQEHRQRAARGSTRGVDPVAATADRAAGPAAARGVRAPRSARRRQRPKRAIDDARAFLARWLEAGSRRGLGPRRAAAQARPPAARRRHGAQRRRAGRRPVLDPRSRGTRLEADRRGRRDRADRAAAAHPARLDPLQSGPARARAARSPRASLSVWPTSSIRAGCS